MLPPSLDAGTTLESCKWAIASATDASCTELTITINVMLIPRHTSANPVLADALRSHPCAVEFGLAHDGTGFIEGSLECRWQAEPPEMESLCERWDGISIWLAQTLLACGNSSPAWPRSTLPPMQYR